MKNLVLIFFTCCSTLILFGQQNIQKELQTQFITIEDGGTIELPEGYFQLNKSLWLDGKNKITIIGAGMDKTILSFKDQKEGAEGIKVTNAKDIRLEGFTVQDSKGDAIKTQDVDGISFISVKAEWTGKPKKTNGAYGLYPVQCYDVLIAKCEAIGASDAGIYVGQSDKVVVRNCRAYHNVAGIEIENTTNADVYNNTAEENTGGILVFDLPGLIKKNGGHTRLYNNRVLNNNYKNFAPKGNIVATVPSGTGILIMAGNDIDIYSNEIIGHKTFSLSIVSYHITELEIKDQAYDPYSYRVYAHKNTYVRKKQFPTLSNKMGLLALMKFGREVPDIIVDGIYKKNHLNKSGRLKRDYEICFDEAEGTTFANLDAGNKFENLTREMTKFQCKAKLMNRMNVIDPNEPTYTPAKEIKQ